MSADNWAVCPKCKLNRTQHEKFLTDSLKSDYGKIAPEDYVARLDNLNRTKAAHDQETLREDYELGVGLDGEFFCYYGCSCNVCSFSFKFKHKEVVCIGEKS